LDFVAINFRVAVTALPGPSVDGTEDEECGANDDADRGCVEVKDTQTTGQHGEKPKHEFSRVAAPFGGARFWQG